MRFAVNCSMLFTDLPVLQRPAAARAAGFDAVEFWWPFPDAVPAQSEVDAFVGAVRDSGVRLTGLNLTGGDMAAGERGVLSDPARATMCRANLDVAVGIAEALGVKAFNALYGNRVPGADPRRQDEVAVSNLAMIARAADRLGAVVVIEPLSAVPSYPLRTARDALDVIDRVESVTGPSPLRLLADLYHLHVNGDDVAAVIDEHLPRIGHVQIADAPGRGEPGTGCIDIAGHLDRLAAGGYRGLVGLEYLPTGADPFGWLGGARGW